MSTNSQYALFVVARLSGILVKPLILFLLLRFGLNEISIHYSKLLICLYSIYSIFKVPIHFNFYKKEFSTSIQKEEEKRFTRNKYIFRSINLSKILFPISFIFCSIIFWDLFFGFFVSLLLLSEKYFDEVQRYQQYKKDFFRWSILFLSKSYIPVIVVILFIYFNLDNLIFPGLVFSSLMSNLIFSFKLSELRLNRKTKIFFTRIISYLLLFKSIIFEQGSRYLLIIFTAIFFQVDRLYISLFYNSQNLAEISSMAQILNIMPIGISYFYIHINKAAFTRKDHAFLLNLFGLKMIAIMLLLLFLATSVVVFQYFYFDWVNIFSKNFIIFYILAFLVLGIDLILNEYQFWNESPSMLLFIEIITLAIFIILVLILGIGYLSFAFFISATLKLLSHFYLLKLNES